MEMESFIRFVVIIFAVSLFVVASYLYLSKSTGAASSASRARQERRRSFAMTVFADSDCSAIDVPKQSVPVRPPAPRKTCGPHIFPEAVALNEI